MDSILGVCEIHVECHGIHGRCVWNPWDNVWNSCGDLWNRTIPPGIHLECGGRVNYCFLRHVTTVQNGLQGLGHKRGVLSCTVTSPDLSPVLYRALQVLIGTGWFQVVPTGFQLVSSSSDQNPLGTTWNQLKSSQNCLEPTGSNWYQVPE